MDETEKIQIDRSAVFNLFTYLDYNVSEKYLGSSFGTVIENIAEPGIVAKDEYKQIVAAMEQDPTLKDCIYLGQSCDENTEDLTNELIQGAAFQDPDGNLYVAYRGTGNGRWLDNGEGMTAEKTEMQEAAAEYFDRIAEDYGAAVKENGGEIIVTGHSKGGNEAQYVTMAAEHSDMIDACYSFDGQGFSAKAIESFQENLGEEGYSERLGRMYSICGTDDYVHPLGNTVIPEENTYYVGTSGETSLEQAHSLKYMLGEAENGSVTYGGIQWADETDNNGHGTQGEYGKAAGKLSENMMSLPEEELDGTARTIMDAANTIMAKLDGQEPKHLGSYTVNEEDREDFLRSGLPAVGETVKEISEEKLNEGISSSLDNIEESTSSAWNRVKESVSSAWNSIREKAASAWEGMKETAEKAWDGIGSFFGKIRDGLSSVFKQTGTGESSTERTAEAVIGTGSATEHGKEEQSAPARASAESKNILQVTGTEKTAEAGQKEQNAEPANAFSNSRNDAEKKISVISGAEQKADKILSMADYRNEICAKRQSAAAGKEEAIAIGKSERSR